MLKLLSTSQEEEEVEQDAAQSADLPPIQREKISTIFIIFIIKYTLSYENITINKKRKLLINS